MADQKTIQEEAGLPDNWQPIDVPPIVPGQPAQNSPNGGGGKYLTGSLPPAQQHDTSFTGTAYEGSRTPKLSLMPLGIQGDPSTNAGIQSTAKITQGTTPASVVTGGMNFQGMWQSFTTYAIHDVVIFNLSAYVALQVNTAQQPDNNLLAWELLSENLVFNPTPVVTPGTTGFGAFDKSSAATALAAPITAGPLVPANSQGWAVLAEVNIGNPSLLPSSFLPSRSEA